MCTEYDLEVMKTIIYYNTKKLGGHKNKDYLE